MVAIIKKNAGKKEISKLLGKLTKKKGFNAKKHSGVIKLKENPLAIQKKLRNEWE